MTSTRLSLLFLFLPVAGCLPNFPRPTKATTGPVPTFHRAEGPLCNPKEVIERAITARGGEALLRRQQQALFQGKGVSAPQNQVASFKFRTFSVLPDRIRDESDYEGGTRFVQVLNRDKGWVSINNEVKDMDPVNLKSVRDLLYVNQLLTLVPLRESRFTFEPLPQQRKEGVIADGFVIKCKDQRDVTLFVEKENGLPLMVKSRVMDPNLYIERDQETYFSQYSAMQGLQFPRHWVVYTDANKAMELTFEEIKFLDKVDEVLFTKP